MCLLWKSVSKPLFKLRDMSVSNLSSHPSCHTASLPGGSVTSGTLTSNSFTKDFIPDG